MHIGSLRVEFKLAMSDPSQIEQVVDQQCLQLYISL